MTEFGGAFAGKTVLVTGHTGFKGSWLSLWLHGLGAKVAGFALPPETPSLFESLGLARQIDSRHGDVRDAALVRKTLREVQPEIVFHLAAQPLVRLSYDEPAETFATNVLGTANVLDAVRRTDSTRVCQVITTDKCYENREEAGYAYAEDDRLGGRDPYSASKACAEIVAASYRASFFGARRGRILSLSTTRAGNVIGGGDWATIDFCPTALARSRRRPACRGAQSALDAAVAVRARAFVRLFKPGFAPARRARFFRRGLELRPAPRRRARRGPRRRAGRPRLGFRTLDEPAADPAAPHEAGCLELDSAKAAARLGWKPAYGVEQAVAKTIAWYRAAAAPGFDAAAFSRAQIEEYVAAARIAGAAWTAPLAAGKAR